MIRLFLLVLLFFGSVCLATQQQFQPVYFNNQTLKLNLPVGQERMIKLPFAAKLHVQPSVSRLMHVVIQDDVLLITASKAFTSGRAKLVSLQRNANHPVILLNLTANESASVQPIEVIVPSLMARHDTTNSNTPSGNAQPKSAEHPYISLARYALQNAFAPERIIEPVSGISKVNVFRGELPLYQGGELITQVHSSYRLGRVYATVVRLDNQSTKTVDIDPRKFRGDWLARAGFVFRVLELGSAKNTTAFVLISDKPFEDVVGHLMKLRGASNG